MPTLTPGTRIGRYEVLSAIGVGGMGEVHRARDTRLDRQVAIKVLPDAFAGDADRLARFEREAKLLASLNHPHIAQIYGLEDGLVDGARVQALVMELVEGEDLSARIARGRLPLDEALLIARQVAEALEAAHGAGIIHRDLKPANIKVSEAGTVKVLDFGLAKAGESASAATVANSPTFTSPVMTAAGVILGTAAYMSPEQARGKAVDARADIWAFGCVLYEMLAGRRAFDGETVTDILAAIVHKEPAWTALPAETPAAVRDVLERCLRKDTARRVHHLADARITLEDAQAAPAAPAAAVARAGATSWARAIVVGLLAAVAGALSVWVVLSQRPAAPVPVYSFTSPGEGFNTVSRTAISHDGKWVAYSPEAVAAPFRLFVRALESFEAREVAASVGASGLNPFFSPDDRWLAFFKDDALYKVAVTGGAPERIAPFVSNESTGVWAPDGTIIVAGIFRIENMPRRALASVPAGGGELRPIAKPNPDETHLDPEILPDGRTLLFTIEMARTATIAAMPIGGGEPRVILDDARTPRYSATGHLLFQRVSTGDLFGVRFDPVRLTTAGDATRLAAVARLGAAADFNASSNGTLIYSGPDDTSVQAGFTIVSVDRSGAETPILSEPGTWATPRLSPDGRLLLFRSISSPNCDLWAVDLVRGTRTRLTFEGDNHDPVWRPGGQITWTSQQTGPREMRIAHVDRPTQVAALAKGSNQRTPDSWSRDGARLAFTEQHPATGLDLWVWSANGGDARPIAATQFNESHAAFSPDGAWIAYVSNESGREEVYVQRADGGGGRLLLSTNGGDSPLWSPDGRELFYVEGQQLMAVDTGTRGPALQVTRPRVLLKGPYVWERPGNYDVAQDGRRFFFIRRGEEDDFSATLRVLVNWPSRLR